MIKQLPAILACTGCLLVMQAEARTVEIKLVETSDVHGNYYPEDFINRVPAKGSLARVSSYVDSVRGAMGDDRVVLLDNGDILQGTAHGLLLQLHRHGGSAYCVADDGLHGI